MNLQPNKTLAIRKIDNEIFIYDRNRSLVHTFNDTGAFLWELFEQGTTKDDMVLKLTEAYEIDRETAMTDIEAFLETIQSLYMAT